jgi:hypothetical protein
LLSSGIDSNDVFQEEDDEPPQTSATVCQHMIQCVQGATIIAFTPLSAVTVISEHDLTQATPNKKLCDVAVNGHLNQACGLTPNSNSNPNNTVQINNNIGGKDQRDAAEEGTFQRRLLFDIQEEAGGTGKMTGKRDIS